MIWLRQKDDPMNAVMSGFITGGVLAIRGGANLAFKNALIGGGILFLIEGVSVLMQAVMMQRQQMMNEHMQKLELEKMKQAQNTKNPWEVDFDEGESASRGGDNAQSYNF
jgi:import inner membrane translocase subunit TIM17